MKTSQAHYNQNGDLTFKRQILKQDGGRNQLSKVTTAATRQAAFVGYVVTLTDAGVV